MFRNLLPELKKQSLESRRPTSIADLMEEFWKRPFGTAAWPFAEGGQYPAVDVSENDKEITVKAELPGLEPKDVDISLDRGVLTLKGEKKFEQEEKKDDYHRIERSYGSFYRSLTLPAEVKEEEVSAKFDKGILTITLPKSEKAKTKKIEIKG